MPMPTFKHAYDCSQSVLCLSRQCIFVAISANVHYLGSQTSSILMHRHFGIEWLHLRWSANCRFLADTIILWNKPEHCLGTHQQDTGLCKISAWLLRYLLVLVDTAPAFSTVLDKRQNKIAVHALQTSR